MKKALMLLVVLLAVRCASFRTLDPASPDVKKFAASGATMIDVEGLHVRVVDEGPPNDPLPLVLLHGISSSLETWDGWAADLRRDHRIVRIDLPGSGLTNLHDRRIYLPETDVAVVRAVIDRLGIKHFSIAGNSLGGWTAWLLAGDASTRERVDNLILISSIGLHDRSTSLDRMPKFMKKISAHWTPRFIGALGLRWARGSYRPPTSAEVDRCVAMARIDGNRVAVAGRLLSPFRNYTATLANISAPTLILWGSDDAAPLTDALDFHSRIPHATLVVLPNRGHVSMETDPVTTAALARQFLATHSVTPPADAKFWPPK
jgi:pimeloyl-ACP methyl ester carboxylesterase